MIGIPWLSGRNCLASTRHAVWRHASRSEAMATWIEDIGVVVSADNTILALTMDLDALYDSLVISLDWAPYTQQSNRDHHGWVFECSLAHQL